MPVGQLRREADRIAWNGALSLHIQVSAAEGTVVHSKAQLCKKRVPEGKQLPKVQAQGQPDLASPAGDRLVAQNQLPLVCV